MARDDRWAFRLRALGGRINATAVGLIFVAILVHQIVVHIRVLILPRRLRITLRLPTSADGIPVWVVPLTRIAALGRILSSAILVGRRRVVSIVLVHLRTSTQCQSKTDALLYPAKEGTACKV